MDAGQPELDGLEVDDLWGPFQPKTSYDLWLKQGGSPEDTEQRSPEASNVRWEGQLEADESY